MKKEIGDLFQGETKYHRGKLPGGPVLWDSRPKLYKRYPSAPIIKLERMEKEADMPLSEAIKNRRSIRNFQDKPLKKSHLSRLLWATQGITERELGYELRGVPSAGALYPVETYLVIHNVENIDPGVYHYAVQNHEIEQLRTGDFRVEITRSALDQDMAYAANVVFIWTAIFQRSKWKYKQRAYRYVYLDAGHIAQNLALSAVALRLGTCQIGALYDDEVNRLLKIDGDEESVIYMSVAGHPR